MPKDAITTERDARREMIAVCCAIAMRKTTPPKNLTAWGKQLFWLKLKKHEKKHKKHLSKKLSKSSS